MNKLYYSITEVEAITGVKAPTLRSWEEQIPQLKPDRTEGGTRRYSSDDIELIETIKYMMDEDHLTMEGVRSQLANRRKTVERNIKVIRHLESIRKELEEIRLELNSVMVVGEKEKIID